MAWRKFYDEITRVRRPKVGRYKFPSDPRIVRFAVAVREGSELWLALWIQRSRKGEFFVMVPRRDRSSDLHTSYHRSGRLHTKYEGTTGLPRRLQALNGRFQGTEHIGYYGGFAPKRVGAICDPNDFNGILEIPPGILKPRDGSIVVDVVEPDVAPMPWAMFNAGELLHEETFKDCEPWVVVRIGSRRAMSGSHVKAAPNDPAAAAPA
jgi:hypothetical protein